MLGKQDAVATVAVKNLAAAKKFYEGALGLKPCNEALDVRRLEGFAKVVPRPGRSAAGLVFRRALCRH